MGGQMTDLRRDQTQGDAAGETTSADAAPASRRLLAVDFGEKRIGLAVSQGSLALPLATIARTSDAAAAAAIAEVVRDEGVTALVVGEPRRLDGTEGDAARRVQAFARRLETATGLTCIFVDEALTSRAAEERLRAAGVDPRRHPERVDQVAAQLLLEEALAREERSQRAAVLAGEGE
jgi:putative Holliday junction resolvase